MSALQALGIESMTMSSRLRTSNGRHGTLQDIENTINSTGKRRIAKFEMNIADPDVLSERTKDELARSEKTNSKTSEYSSEDVTELESFDIDTFTKDYRLVSSKTNRSEHIFARAEAYRGAWSLSDKAGRNPRDRFGSGPAVERYVLWCILLGSSSPVHELITSLCGGLSWLVSCAIYRALYGEH